jgi:hypothetical protein
MDVGQRGWRRKSNDEEEWIDQFVLNETMRKDG